MIVKHLLAVWIAICLISGTLAFAVYNGQNTRAQQNQGLRTFICFFESAVLKSKNSTPKQRRDAIRFFDHVLEQIHQPPCQR